METDEHEQSVRAFVRAGLKVSRSQIAVELQEIASSAIDLQRAGAITDAQRRALVEATLVTMKKFQEVTAALSEIVHAIGGGEEWPDVLPGGDLEA